MTRMLLLLSNKYSMSFLSTLLSKGSMQSSASTLTRSLFYNAIPIPLHQSSQAHRFTPAHSIPTAF